MNFFNKVCTVAFCTLLLAPLGCASSMDEPAPAEVGAGEATADPTTESEEGEVGQVSQALPAPCWTQTSEAQGECKSRKVCGWPLCNTLPQCLYYTYVGVWRPFC